MTAGSDSSLHSGGGAKAAKLRGQCVYPWTVTVIIQ